MVSKKDENRQLSLIEKWEVDARMYEEVAKRNPERYKKEMDIYDQFQSGKMSLSECRQQLKKIKEEYDN